MIKYLPISHRRHRIHNTVCVERPAAAAPHKRALHAALAARCRCSPHPLHTHSHGSSQVAHTVYISPVFQYCRTAQFSSLHLGVADAPAVRAFCDISDKIHTPAAGALAPRPESAVGSRHHTTAVHYAFTCTRTDLAFCRSHGVVWASTGLTTPSLPS